LAELLMADHKMPAEVLSKAVHFKPASEYFHGALPLHRLFPVRTQLDDGTMEFAPQTLAV
jgi:hypothetical protein